MELKKVVPAIVVSYIVLFALAYLIHDVWLASVYNEYKDLWRPEEVMRHKMWVTLIGQLIFVVMFVWIYTRGVENKPWVGQGIRYGIMMTLLIAIPFSCSEYVVLSIPYTLAVKWMIGGAVEMIILGLITAGFCKPSPAA